MEIIVGVVATVALVAAAIAVERHRHCSREPAGWLGEAVRRRLLIHTVDGQTIDGQLARVDADGLVLAPAMWEGYELGGQVWVPRERVAWAQQPETAMSSGG